MPLADWPSSGVKRPFPSLTIYRHEAVETLRGVTKTISNDDSHATDP